MHQRRLQPADVNIHGRAGFLLRGGLDRSLIDDCRELRRRLVNRSDKDAVYLEIGTRAKSEYVEYPDVDLAVRRDENGPRFFRLNGEPYQPK